MSAARTCGGVRIRKVLQQYSSDLLRGLEPSNPDQSRYPALLARNLHKNESGFLLC